MSDINAFSKNHIYKGNYNSFIKYKLIFYVGIPYNYYGVITKVFFHKFNVEKIDILDFDYGNIYKTK